MKAYTFFLKGTSVNGQFSCAPVWFVFRVAKYAATLRVWRFQITVSY